MSTGVRANARDAGGRSATKGKGAPYAAAAPGISVAYPTTGLNRDFSRPACFHTVVTMVPYIFATFGFACCRHRILKLPNPETTGEQRRFLIWRRLRRCSK